jgi:hypothetical protein
MNMHDQKNLILLEGILWSLVFGIVAKLELVVVAKLTLELMK